MRKLAALALVLVSGCACMARPGYQLVQFGCETPGAMVTVDSGASAELAGHAQARLSRRMDHTVTVSAPGFMPKTAEIRAHYDWWFLLDDAFWSLFLTPVGVVFVIVDAFSDSIYSLHPDLLEFTLVSDGTGVLPFGKVADPSPEQQRVDQRLEHEERLRRVRAERDARH